MKCNFELLSCFSRRGHCGDRSVGTVGTEPSRRGRTRCRHSSVIPLQAVLNIDFAVDVEQRSATLFSSRTSPSTERAGYFDGLLYRLGTRRILGFWLPSLLTLPFLISVSVDAFYNAFSEAYGAPTGLLSTFHTLRLPSSCLIKLPRSLYLLHHHRRALHPSRQAPDRERTVSQTQVLAQMATHHLSPTRKKERKRTGVLAA